MQKKIKEELIPIALSVIKQADITGNAAELAYYLLLALFPLLLFIANIIPLLPLDSEIVLNVVQNSIPEQVAPLILPTLNDYLDTVSPSALSINIILVLWSASAGFNSLQKVLNNVYGKESYGNFILNRLISFLILSLLVIIVGLCSTVLVFGETVFNFINRYIELPMPLIRQLLNLNWPILLIVLFGFFVFVYWLVPNVQWRFKYVYVGALASAILALLLSSLFGVYVHYFGGSSVSNGTFGVFIVLMLYLYLTAIVLVIGGVINVIYYQYHHADHYRGRSSSYHIVTSDQFPKLQRKSIAYHTIERLGSDVRIIRNQQREEED